MSCVLCTDGCKYCQPDIPEWYRKSIPAKRMTQMQLTAVQAGLHPSGLCHNEESSPTNRCGACKNRSLVPGSMKYVDCTKVESEDLKLMTIYTWGCTKFESGPASKAVRLL